MRDAHEKIIVLHHIKGAQTHTNTICGKLNRSEIQNEFQDYLCMLGNIRLFAFVA